MPMAAALTQHRNGPALNQFHIGNSTRLSVESQSDNGIDPDDTALHLSPHRKDALRALPFPDSPTGKDSRPHTLRRCLSQHHSARRRSPRLRGEAGRQHHTVTDQRIQRGRFRNQPGDRAGRQRTGQASDVSVRQPAFLPISLIPGGHQAGGEHGGRSGQAFSPFCGISTRLHARVVTQPADSRHDGVGQGPRQLGDAPALGHVSGSDHQRRCHVPASDLR